MKTRTSKKSSRRGKTGRKKAVRKARTYTRVSRQPVAERFFTKLSYSENVGFTSTIANTMNTYQFRTSIYDPDFTGGGHQPLYRDELALLYKSYRVYGMRYHIYAKNQDTTYLTFFAVTPSSTGVFDSNYDTIKERRESHFKYMQGPQGAPTYIKGYISVAKTFGISKQEFIADDSFMSDMSTHSAKCAYLQLYFSTSSPGTANVVAAVQIDYFVELFNRIDINSS